MAYLLLGALLVGAGGVLWWRCEGEPPRLEAPSELALGRSPRTLTLSVADARSAKPAQAEMRSRALRSSLRWRRNMMLATP